MRWLVRCRGCLHGSVVLMSPELMTGMEGKIFAAKIVIKEIGVSRFLANKVEYQALKGPEIFKAGGIQ